MDEAQAERLTQSAIAGVGVQPRMRMQLVLYCHNKTASSIRLLVLVPSPA